MIPFQLHRRIPLIRRPFYQRDILAATNATLNARLEEAEQEKRALRAERDAVRGERDTLLYRARRTGPPNHVHHENS